MKDGALKLLFFCNSIFVLAGSLLGPLYAVYVQGLGHDGILTISSSWSIFLFSTTLCTFIISRIGDKARKDDLLIAGFLVRAFIWIAFIFINSIAELIMLQALLGFGEALGSPAFDTIFAEHLDKNVHIREYADWHLLSNIVTASGTLIGGFIVSRFGFPLLFICMSFGAFVATLITLLNPKRAQIG